MMECSKHKLLNTNVMLLFLGYAKENVSYSEGVALILSNEAEKTLLE